MTEDVREEIPRRAVTLLLERNEHIVSRCALLTHFSALLIAISLFIAERPKIFTAAWESWLFYLANGIWGAAIVWLLVVLRHGLPVPWELGKDEDFTFTARLYVARLRAYNVARRVTIVSFLIVTGLLIPFQAYHHDVIFDQMESQDQLHHAHKPGA